jgi:hypothetical protein
MSMEGRGVPHGLSRSRVPVHCLRRVASEGSEHASSAPHPSPVRPCRSAGGRPVHGDQRIDQGVVTGDSGAVLPGVTVTITNLDTGEVRVVATNDSGLDCAPLFPLGR